MAGYIIELYKNIRSAEGYQPREKGSDDKKYNFGKKTYVTFGDFDKMAISKVNAFSRMRDMSELSRSWIGDRQTILLYEISKENEVTYQNTAGSEGIYIKTDTEMQLSDSLFIAVSILQFKEGANRTETDMKQCLNTYRKNILTLINDKKSKEVPVHCSVLGILGTYGLAILWTSDQFVEILRLINHVKGIDVKADTKTVDYDFLSFFSIFAKNNLSDEMLKSKLDKAEGMAMLQVTLESNLNSAILEQFKEELHTADFFHSAGEHDLIIKTDIKNLYRLFEKKKLLDPDEKFYYENILQTNVRLCDEIDEKSVEAVPQKTELISEKEELSSQKEKKQPDNELSELVKEVESRYKDLRVIFFNNFPKTAGMVDSLDLLYGDFISKISSVSNRMWAYDFGYQFLSIINVIEKYLNKFLEKEIEVATSQILKDIRDLWSPTGGRSRIV